MVFPLTFKMGAGDQWDHGAPLRTENALYWEVVLVAGKVVVVVELPRVTFT